MKSCWLWFICLSSIFFGFSNSTLVCNYPYATFKLASYEVKTFCCGELPVGIYNLNFGISGLTQNGTSIYTIRAGYSTENKCGPYYSSFDYYKEISDGNSYTFTWTSNLTLIPSQAIFEITCSNSYTCSMSLFTGVQFSY